MAGVKEFFLGSPAKLQQLPLYNQGQQGVQNQLIAQLPGLFQKQQSGFDFAPIAQQARNDFQSKTLPSIAERFTALGNQGSGAYRNALLTAGTGLDQGLAALNSQYNLQQSGQNQNALMGLLQLILKPQGENIYHPEQPGALSHAGTAGSALGGLIGTAFGGPAGGFAGGAIGSGLGNGLEQLIRWLSSSGQQESQSGNGFESGFGGFTRPY